MCVGERGYLRAIEDANLDEATFLLVVQDAVGGKTPVAIVIKLDPSSQTVRVLR